MIDLTGKIFGTLFVENRAKNNKYGQTMWNCVCQKCGRQRIVNGNNLRSGHTKSCQNKMCSGNVIDITGQTFNKLKVLKYLGNSLWDCKCECGKHVQVSSYELKNGVVKSCGMVSCGGRKQLNLKAGEEFDNWVVLGPAREKHNSKGKYYCCQCKCGTIKDVSASSLRQHKSKSCGCIKSQGESKISSFLISHKITFKSQWNNDKQMRLSNGYPVFFDYAIYKNPGDKNPTFCLEYNGEQHYIHKNKGWNTKNHLERTKQRDLEKKCLCEKENIPLEIISYKDFDKLEEKLESLLEKYKI